MSKYILTVIFKSKINTGACTSQVYYLDSTQQVEFLYSKLCKSFSGYIIDYSVACISELGGNHVP